jgi:hypothetical protein
MTASSLSELLASQLPTALRARASRLRHQSDSLVSEMVRRGMAVSSLRVSVNPELLASAAPHVDKPGLPAAALDSLAQLNTEIEEGPLKQALGRLLRHHGKASPG